jgi:hypothetical protein
MATGNYMQVASKVVRIMSDYRNDDDRNQKVVDDTNWSQVEDALNDQLPAGYYAKVDDA